MNWLILALLCVTPGLLAQNSGRVTGGIAGEKMRPLRGDVTVVMAGVGVRIHTLATDEQGVFIGDVPPGRAILIARADGYVSEQREVFIRPGTHNAPVHFALAQAGTVSGCVFDENGAGLGGARIWLTYRGEPARSWRLAEETGGESADAFGYFTLPVVAQGRPFVLHAESDNRLPSTSGTLILRGAEMTGVVLLLSRRGINVHGRVIDASGYPLAGAEVSLRVLPDDDGFTVEQRASIAFAHRTNRVAISTADGSYAFAGVPAGQLVVRAEAGGRRTVTEARATPGKNTEINLRLR